MTHGELAQAISNASRLRGQFRLRSGRASTEYFDKYQFEARPALLRAIANQLVPLVPSATGVLAGLELGGVPIATALSLDTGIPLALVRKAAKSYGTERLAEGADVSGRRVVLVEDVVTSGGQLVESIEALRSLGADVAHALCVIDRQEGGAERLRDAGVELRALFRRRDLASAET
jgi:orotate phosphoribosyltransferase